MITVFGCIGCMGNIPSGLQIPKNWTWARDLGSYYWSLLCWIPGHSPFVVYPPQSFEGRTLRRTGAGNDRDRQYSASYSLTSLHRIKTFFTKYMSRESKYHSSIYEWEPESDGIGFEMDDSCRADEIFEIEWLEIGEYDEYCFCKIEIQSTTRPESILEYNIASMSDDSTRDRHEHSNTRRYDRRKKETQGEEW